MSLFTPKNRTLRILLPIMFFVLWTVRPALANEPTRVKTLILTNLSRMQEQMELEGKQIRELSHHLQKLADHPRVQGEIIRLEQNPALARLYAAWDAAASDADLAARANELLFGNGGIHDYLRTEILPAYSGAEYLVLVGDDRIIPMARLADGTTLLEESTYATEAGAARHTTVGRALAENLYLSDDPLASRRAVHPDSLRNHRSLFLADLSVGRLVETPEEIAGTIATFLRQDGVLDLTQRGTNDPKVLVTGYDLMTDMAQKVGQSWSARLGGGVDSELASADWGASSVEARRAKLRSSLEGQGGGRSGLLILNGHTTHDRAGVPGESPFAIQGLAAGEMYGPDACSGNRPAGLDLAGGVVFSLGCHAGLPVAGSCSADRSLDLPQTFLGRGALTYVANTGFGWALLHGIGYSERLMEILNEDLVASEKAATGDAVRQAKRRYAREKLRIDAYDRKTLMQWTLFGLPMVEVHTGSVPRLMTTAKGGIVIETTPAAPDASVPSHLISVQVSALLTAPGLYVKHDAAGRELPAGTRGCPDPAGCYYTLNDAEGKMLGTPGRPLEPYVVLTPEVAGARKQGTLWKGGIYEEESGWVPVITRLVSGSSEIPALGATPEQSYPPLPPPDGVTISGGSSTEAAFDSELSRVILPAGQAFRNLEAPESWSVHRIHRRVDLEFLYGRRSAEPEASRDLAGPVIDEGLLKGEYHRVDAASGSVEWVVPASDAAGVWRVVVVYDAGPDAQGKGAWRPLELTETASGIWKGEMQLPETASRLTYIIQAVDERGNVSSARGEAVVKE